MCACNMWENGLALNSNNDNLATLSTNGCGCNNSMNNGCNMCNDTNSGCQCNLRTSNPNTRSLTETLRNNIGRRCCCEFLVGNNLVKRSGTICQVGTNYIALASNNTNCGGCMFCSTDNLNFIRVE